MKNILKFAAALAVMVTVSCNKEMTAPDNYIAHGVKVRVNVTTDSDTKVTLDGSDLKWEENDKIYLRWGNTKYSSLYACDTLFASSAGNNVAFTGEFNTVQIPNNENLYVYSAAASRFVTSGGVIFRKDLSNIQTGKLEDLKDNAVFAGFVGKNNIKKVYAEDNTTITEIELDAEMKTFFSVVKINVPEEMGLTKITMSAGDTTKLAGTLKLHSARGFGQVGRVDADDALYRRYPTDTQYGEITITNGGEVLSGDVYIVVLPDSYDVNKKEYFSDIESLTFKLTNYAGEYTFTSALKSPIYRATLKDLGAIPSTLAPAGTLCLSGGDRSSVKVNIKNPNSAYKFYYEIAASEEQCQSPTVSSAELDVATGISPDVTGSYSEYYIKVFADTELNYLEDCYIEGYLRSWRFLENCPTAGVLATWENTSEPVTTTDGLYISNSKLYANGIEYRQASEYMAIRTHAISLNALPVYNSKFWMNFYVGSNTVGYNLNVGNATSGKSTYNGYPTSHKVTGSSNNCFTWYLGDVTPGLNLALRSDNKHNYYRMTVLEVL